MKRYLRSEGHAEPDGEPWIPTYEKPTPLHIGPSEVIVDGRRYVPERMAETIASLIEQRDKAQEELAEMTRRKDEYVEELRACNVALHDQKQHEIGLQCAELQSMVNYLASIAANYTFRGKDISLGEETELLKDYARKYVRGEPLDEMGG